MSLRKAFARSQSYPGSLVREDETGKIHDGSRCHQGWLPSRKERMSAAETLRSFFLCGMVASLDGIGFRHVFSLFRLPVPASARLVIHARLRVDPDHS